MRSSGDAGGLKELAKESMSSTNFALGMPRAFLPSVMDSSEMFAMGASAWVDMMLRRFDQAKEVMSVEVRVASLWAWMASV